MPSYTHVIWDWNGTIFNDAWLCREILNQLLTARQIATVSEQRYQEVFGFPIKEYYRKVGFDFKKEPFEVPAHEFIDVYEARRLECSIRSEAGMVLDAIRNAGIGQSVLSAYEQSTLNEIIAHFSLSVYFTAICGLDNPYAASKVDIGRNMLLELDQDPAGIIMVGDTTHDKEVADAIGVQCLLMPGGHQTRERLESCGVKVVGLLGEVLETILFAN